jgi:hypothetical protein
MFTDADLVEAITAECGDLDEALWNESWGACRACGEASLNHEPDATANWCPCCGKKGVVVALGVLLGVI